MKMTIDYSRISHVHIHHIARYQGDAAWPAPIWGKFTPLTYETAEQHARLELMQREISALSAYS